MTMADTFDKLPPHSIEAEACLLACMMLDKQTADDVRAVASEDWFYLADHQIVFSAIAGMRSNGSNVDAILLRDALKKSGQLEDIGGAAYIATILGSVPSTAHWADYLAQVREKFQYRQAISLAERVIRQSYEQSTPAIDVLSGVAAGVSKIVSNSTTRNVLTADQVFCEARDILANPDLSPLLSYGFPAIDAELTGQAPGELVLIGARPSMGKSTLMRQMALLDGLAGHPVLYVSMEESPNKIARNVFSWQCGIENKRMRGGRLTMAEMERVKETTERLRRLPIHFVWGFSNVDRVHALAASYQAKYGIVRVYIDYLQLLTTDGGGRDKEYERVTAASDGVRRVARELNLRTICAVQLSREAAKRDDKRPTLTDIRSSGQIEQDADVVMFLHREDYYHIGDAAYQPTRIAELIKAKVRDGERGGEPITLKSNLAFQCFQDMSDTRLYDENRISY